MRRNQTRDLVLMALYVAMFVVLDYITNAAALLQMPNGGSLGLSTIALLMASYHLGIKKGVMIGVGSVFLQFITGPMYTSNLIGFMLDYFIAFGVYGIAAAFPNIGPFYSGVLITNALRLVSSTLSGVVAYGYTFEASLAYNASYMIPTAVVGIVIVPLLMTMLKPVLKTEKN